MTVKDLISECKQRPSKKDCQKCVHKSKCDWLKRYLSEALPVTLENIGEVKIPF